MGIAAHITAAAPGGPRYDPTLTPEQRRDASNGIWCCTAHGRLIDADEKQFPVERLREWKTQAEAASARALLMLERVAELASPEDLEEDGREQVGRLGLLPIEDLEAVTGRLRDAAREDLRAFRRALRMPAHAVALNLRLLGEEEETPFSVMGLGSVMILFSHVTVVAAPGTGKTMTLLQATEAILDRDDLVAVFVPLGEWSAQQQPLLRSITERMAFDGLRPEHLKLAAIHRRLVLILDGWNELDRGSVKRLRGELSALERDFPDLCTLISTRRQALDVPRTGPTVEIDSLSEEQQRRIAWAIRGPAGGPLLDQAWRTAGVRELVGIPLYLSTLLTHSHGARLPTTKEEVFRLFLTEHERSGEKAAALHDALLGFHPQILEALAIEATRVGNVALPEEEALKAIGMAVAQLISEHQLSEPFQPKAALDALVSYHVLTRLRGPHGAVAFQHQQFQEFYASARVEELMRAAAGGSRDARAQLRRDVLNERAWEESVLFACERASRTDEAGRAAVAASVREALTIDPMLAADMTYRSSPELWAHVNAEVVAFATAWHEANKVDRAVHFMIDTGRGEFAPSIWPLISSTDRQIYLPALRAGKRFRLSVLGPDVEAKLRALPDEQREHVVSQIGVYGDYAGIEFITRFASTDPSPRTRAVAVEYLVFRRATRQAVEVLRHAPDEVWRLLAEKSFVARDIADPTSAARLETERRRLEDADGNLARRLYRAVQNARDGADNASRVQALIEDSALTFKDPDDATSAIYEAHQLYPDAVRVGLIHRLERRLQVPFRAYELLGNSGVAIDSGPIVDLVIVPGADNQAAAAAVAVVGGETVGRLIDDSCALAREIGSSRPATKELTDEYSRLRRLIEGAHPRAFAQAVLSRAAIRDPNAIGVIASLIGDHRNSPERGKAASYEPQIRDALVSVVSVWGELLLATPNVGRRQLANTANAIGRLASPELLPMLLKMLAEELKRWRGAWETANSARAQGKPAPKDYQESWVHEYRRALVGIGGEAVIGAMTGYLADRGQRSFGIDAALVMSELWHRVNRPPKEGPPFAHEFGDVRARRRARQSGFAEPVAAASEAIFAVVDDLTGSGSDDITQVHALKLARVALSMPYGDRTDTINKLLSLPLPVIAKRDLLHALVLAGELVSADALLEGIHAVLEQAKTQPWVLDPQQGSLHYWLALLPFSNRPRAVLEALSLLPPELRVPRRLTSLLAALGNAPSDEAEEVLAILARENEGFLDRPEWFGALETRWTRSSMHLLLGLASQGKLDNRRGRDDFILARDLASGMNSDPEFRTAVYRSFEGLPRSRGRGLIERAMSEAADAEAVLLITRSYARDGRPINGDLYRALERVAIDRRPSSQWIGAHELLGKPIPELRKALFAFVAARAPEADLARACLNVIDELRDEYGPAQGEPRHPDIDSGLPWPPCPWGNHALRSADV